MVDSLKPGKRYYWFSQSCGCVLSGLYGGERDDLHAGNAVIYRKNGDAWSIPDEDLFEREKEAYKHRCST